jgi:hypothetical protein
MRVRQQVIELLHGQQEQEPATAHAEPWPGRVGRSERLLLSQLQGRIKAIDSRLSAAEQRVGRGAETLELDQQIERVRGEKQAAADAQEYERAASLRDQEWQLLAEKAAHQQEWDDAHPSLPRLAERCAQLSEELDRLHALLRQHGIEPEDNRMSLAAK